MTILLLLIMPETTEDIIDSIKKVLSEGEPLSISQVARKAKIDWRTANHYLIILEKIDLVKSYKFKNTVTYFYKDPDNYFKLPIKEKHQKIISTIYAYIKEFCEKKFQKEPTKTQVYKVIWKVNKELKLNLPIGWYRYGPICMQVYQGKERKEKTLEKKEVILIKNITEEYCFLDNIKLQRKIYEEAKEAAYILKEKILEEENVDVLLMDLVKEVPEETREIVTDFIRTTLLLKWGKTRSYFSELWKYVTLVRLKESLREYYDNVNRYLDEQISSTKKEIQLEIYSLVEHYMKIKYSQDKKFQQAFGNR